jgi:hypothetical protein
MGTPEIPSSPDAEMSVGNEARIVAHRFMLEVYEALMHDSVLTYRQSLDVGDAYIRTLFLQPDEESANQAARLAVTASVITDKQGWRDSEDVLGDHSEVELVLLDPTDTTMKIWRLWFPGAIGAGKVYMGTETWEHAIPGPTDTDITDIAYGITKDTVRAMDRITIEDMRAVNDVLSNGDIDAQASMRLAEHVSDGNLALVADPQLQATLAPEFTVVITAAVATSDMFWQKMADIEQRG